MNNTNNIVIDGLTPIRPRRLTLSQRLRRALTRPRTVTLADLVETVAWSAVGGIGATVWAYILTH